MQRRCVAGPANKAKGCMHHASEEGLRTSTQTQLRKEASQLSTVARVQNVGADAKPSDVARTTHDLATAEHCSTSFFLAIGSRRKRMSVVWRGLQQS